MYRLKFEFKKLSDKRMWIVFLFIPVLVMSANGLYHYFNPENVRSKEMRMANTLQSDFSWRIGENYFANLERIYYYDGNAPELTEEEQRIEELLDAGERARFIYSADSWYEKWDTVNQAKSEIWQILIELDELGVPTSVMDGQALHSEKIKIDWLVDNDVGFLNPDRTSLSAFVLNNSFDILLSLPAIFLIIFFFGIPILDETFHHRYNFTKVLPIKRKQIFGSKFASYLLLLFIYLGVAILTTLVINVLFDDVSLMTQLSYPLVTQTPAGLFQISLGQMLLFRILFFVLLNFLMLFSIYILSVFWSNMLSNTIMVGFVSIIALIIVQGNKENYRAWNVFAWLDPSGFIEVNSQTTIYLVLLILFILMGLAAYLVIHLLTWVNRSRSSKLYRGLKPSSNTFLIKHEWMSFMRDKSLLYCLFGILILSVYLGTIAQQEQNQREQAFLTTVEQYSSMVDERIASTPQMIEELELLVEISIEPDLTQYQTLLDTYKNETTPFLEREREKVDRVLAGEYDIWLDYEKTLVESDRDYVVNPSNSLIESPFTTIPAISNHIFIPNAVINDALFQWKESYQLPFILPGAPYKTALLPTYEVSPRSGEGQPPQGIDYNSFERYLNARQGEHNVLSGLNLSVDLLNKYLYLFIWLILAVFFMLNYVKEWDLNQTIRFIKVLPVKIRQIFTNKTIASHLTSVSIVLVAMLVVFIIGTLLGGVGFVNFPFVRYIPKFIGDLTKNEEVFIRIPTYNQYFTIIPLWRYLLEGLGLLLLLTVFINQVVHFMSLLVKKRWVTLAVSGIVLVLGYALVAVYPQAWMQFLPFYYLNIPDILTGLTAFEQDFTMMNPYYGMGIILCYIIVFECINRILVRKDERRDIR